MSLGKRAAAEFFGTFWLVFGGVGSAVIAAKFLGSPELGNVGIGFLGVAFAFGLTVVTMAYAIGPISGASQPAVSLGRGASGSRVSATSSPRWPAPSPPAALRHRLGGRFTPADGFGSNGYGAHSPGGYSWRR
jgi:aquaporin Z